MKSFPFYGPNRYEGEFRRDFTIYQMFNLKLCATQKNIHPNKMGYFSKQLDGRCTRPLKTSMGSKVTNFMFINDIIKPRA